MGVKSTRTRSEAVVIQSKSFLGTLNALTTKRADRRTQSVDPDRARQLVLNCVREGEASEAELANLALPASMLEEAVDALVRLNMIERVELDGHAVYRLTPYAAKALTYLSPR